LWVEALNVDAPLPRRCTRIRLPIDFRLLYMLPKAAYKTVLQTKYSNPIAKTEADPLLRDLELLARLPFARKLLTELVVDAKELIAQDFGLQEIE